MKIKYEKNSTHNKTKNIKCLGINKTCNMQKHGRTLESNTEGQEISTTESHIHDLKFEDLSIAKMLFLSKSNNKINLICPQLNTEFYWSMKSNSTVYLT